MSKVMAHIDQNKKRYQDELFELLRIPSISADPDRAADIRRAAEFVKAKLAAMGCQARIYETPGHPLVYGEWLGAKGRPTVLFYGHYDVQPPDPLELWHSQPFEPTVRDGNVYARGASDDKGQFLANVLGVESFFQTNGGPPVNVKFLIEGEEEVTSTNLEHFVAANRELLKCDQIVVSDTAQFKPGYPAICYGLRGICYMEVFLRGANIDLHSGEYGGAVPNPANELSRIIAKLHDPKTGKVAIPGFYDDVVELDPKERAELARLPFDETDYKKRLDLTALPGENGYSPIERTWTRPTLDVNGLTSGYQGKGAKTVIPAAASAKISMRLVPNMDPKKVQKQFEDTIRSLCPPYINVRFANFGMAKPVVVPSDSPALARARAALEKGFGAKSVIVRSGGSIPVVETFKTHLGVASLLVGYGLPDDALHSPNEKFSLEDFHRGIRTAAHLLEELAK
ncbi:MAG TPA: dipeptidase [candidate division Zixibacteria bacterium]|jgi:acetylornithine deacetylase/succinyl-diaminopimelate desuccinylase-like protein